MVVQVSSAENLLEVLFPSGGQVPTTASERHRGSLEIRFLRREWAAK